MRARCEAGRAVQLLRPTNILNAQRYSVAPAPGGESFYIKEYEFMAGPDRLKTVNTYA